MKQVRNKENCLFGSIFLALTLVATAATSAPETINIQGSLEAPGGGLVTGSHSARIRFYDAATEGNSLGEIETTLELSTSGRFSIEVAPPPAILSLDNVWYELAVDSNNNGLDAGDVFGARVKVHSVPFALQAGDSDSLGGEPASSYLQSDHLSSQAWTLEGNTLDPLDFLGSVNNQPLVLKVDSQTVFRLIPAATSANIVGGHSANEVNPSAFGATISGGGAGGLDRNSVSGVYGTVAGGKGNTALGPYSVISGGYLNSATGAHSSISGGEGNRGGGNYSSIGGGFNNTAGTIFDTVAGGDENTATGNRSTVGGGRDNMATAPGSVVAGGRQNVAGGDASAIGGGADNIATGFASTVPGGSGNEAASFFTFAAGHRAKALHLGSFVWSDGQNSNFESTTNDQFSIRSQNGIRFASNAGPQKAIAVGDHYRDNGIVAWARVTAAGVLDQTFGVASLTHPSDGVYNLTITAQASGAGLLIPVAVAERDTPPSSAATLRIVSIDQTGGSTFSVYINNGTGAPVDNDFVFMVTGR